MIYTQIQNYTPETKASFDRDLKAAGVNVVLLSSCCEFFKQGEEREKALETLSFGIRSLEEQGYRVAVWTTSLGYGNVRTGEGFVSRFKDCTTLTNFAGSTCGAICSLDPVYIKGMQENVRDFIRAGAKTILWDDELVQSVRPGAFCTCPLHLAKFAERTGREWTREQVRDLFTGAPTPERAAFVDLMGDSMTDFCRALREAADEIDPSVVMGLCASYTHYDAEGVDIRELIRVLAGKGNKPFFRLSGAPYWSVLSRKFPYYGLSDTMEFVRMQIGWLRDEDIDFFDENDSYPRNHYLIPVALTELYDKVILANGGVARHKYMMCFNPADPEGSDRSYLEGHLRNMPLDGPLSEMFEGKKPVGFFVKSFEHGLRQATLPERYCGDYDLLTQFSHPIGGIFLSRYQIPTMYEESADGRYGGDGAGMLWGYNAELLPEERFGDGWLLDREAAKILVGRGADVGVRIADDGSLLPADGARVLYEKDGRDGRGGHAWIWCYTDAAGRRFAVVDYDVWDRCRSNGLTGLPETVGMQAGLASAYEFLSGRKLPILPGMNPGAYVLTSLDGSGKRAAVLLCNMYADAIEVPTFTLDGTWRVVRTLKGEASILGNKLTLARLGPYDFEAVELTRE